MKKVRIFRAWFSHDVLQASRLPRKMQRRQFDPVRRQDSADIYGGAESITPATQIEPDVLQASRLPRKMQRRQFDPVCRQASLMVQKVSRLPCRSSLMCCKCHACMPRKMQRRQFDRIRRRASADIYGGAESTTPATQSEPEVLKVSRLPRKMQRRQFDPVRRQDSADIYGGAEVSCLPRKSSLMCCKCHACHVTCNGANSTQFVAKLPLTSMLVQKVPRLPRKASLRC